MSKRKQANPLRKVADLQRWVQDHVKPFDKSGDPTGKREWGPEDRDAAILWWHAYEQASTMADLSTKDIARMLLDGQPALTLAHVQEELDCLHEMDDDEALTTAAQDIEASLRDHFGLKP